MSVELKEKPEGKTKGQEEQLTDGFHLLIDALKMNDLNTDLRRTGYTDHRLRAHGASQWNSGTVF